MLGGVLFVVIGIGLWNLFDFIWKTWLDGSGYHFSSTYHILYPLGMLTYWSFVLIGMHAGMHLGILSSKLKNKAVKVIAFVLMCGVTVCGFWLFIKANIFDYMLMKTQFAFLDYSKYAWQIIIENLAMLLAWAFAVYLVSLVLKKIKRRKLYR